VFSLRSGDQEGYRRGQKQLFLSVMPKNATGKSAGAKKDETQRAGADVEEIDKSAPAWREPNRSGTQIQDAFRNPK
jgi:hypothetical protein